MKNFTINQDLHNDFIEWLNSDNVIKQDNNTYLEQTTQYRKLFTYNEIFKFFIKEYSTN